MECSKTININSIKRYPINGTFELTVRCNLDCKMCLFRHKDEENPILRKNELTASQWIDMARQIAEAGCVELLITGGEPMLREDFCEIWEGIYKYGFIIQLYTNATLVNDKIMETLRKYPPHKIGITVYGSNNEVYEKVCGVKNGFDLAIKGIKQLQTLPSIVDFRSTIIKDNYFDLENIYKLVEKELGSSSSVVITRMVNQSVRGAKADVTKCRISPKENINLAYFKGLSNIKEIIGDNFDENKLEFIQIEKKTQEQLKLTLFGCEAGMSQFTITHDGFLLGCQMLGLFHTDALHEGFARAWHRYPKIVQMPDPNLKCLNCKVQEYCSACPASKFAETGNLVGCPDYVYADAIEMKSLFKNGEIE